ncbi:MAG: Ppx/GppA phosphatase family protein [Maricaulaceae bacterium]|jgi:exopolyphosphatase/guanosine-5'-triphosphate,3'-diphosphate pyrophosphatase
MDDGAAGGAAGPAARTAPRRSRGGRAQERRRNRGPLFGALDLGTNNCRLLVAARTNGGFQVVDAFSRIVRLGEGLNDTGALSDAAMERTIAALKICAQKLARAEVQNARCIATQACRAAANGEGFLERVAKETGLKLEIITPDEEARLSVMGCLSLIDRESPCALVVDIGGGSTELSWVDVPKLADGAGGIGASIAAWASAPVGVVTLAERFPEGDDHAASYAQMKAHVLDLLPAPEGAQALAPHFEAGEGHLIGTSGTITSIAGVHLELPRYDRNRVDGLWMTEAETIAACDALKALDRDGRARQPCIGRERADAVLAGCAILEAIVERWPSPRLRVADRGLREGMLMQLMHAPKKRRRRRRRRSRRGGGGAAAPQAAT